MTRTDDQLRAEGTNPQALSAKRALERVCSGAGLVPAATYYAPTFVDHVNDVRFDGLEGVQRSVELYKRALSELSITVEDQVVELNRVTSRFIVTGSSYGRSVRFQGITVSHFQDGLIVEDWSVTDTLGMLRQLGMWRACLVALRSWRTVLAASTAPLDSGPQHIASSNHVEAIAPQCARGPTLEA